MNWNRTIKLVIVGGMLYYTVRVGIEMKHILQEGIARRKNEENEEATEVVMSHLYAMKSVLMKNYDGEYEDDLDPEALRNDFEFAKIEYYLKRK